VEIPSPEVGVRGDARAAALASGRTVPYAVVTARARGGLKEDPMEGDDGLDAGAAGAGGVDEQGAAIPSAPEAAEGMPPPPGPAPSEHSAGPPNRTRWKIWLLGALGAAMVLVGAGGAAAFFLLRGTSDVLDRLVPSDTAAYVTVYLDPSAGQKLNLLNLSKKFPALGDPDVLEERINGLLNDALEGSGLTFADIKPWLGTQIAVAARFVSVDEGDVVVLVDSKDDAAAAAALQRARTGPEWADLRWEDHDYNGVQVSVGSRSAVPQGAYAMVGHVVVIGDEPQMVEDVIDRSQGKGDSLRDAVGYKEAVAALPSGKLALAYVDFQSILRTLEESGGLQIPDLSGSLGDLEVLRGMGLTLSAESNGVALDMNVAIDPEKRFGVGSSRGAHRNDVLDFVPEESFGVLAASGLSEQLRMLVDELEKDPAMADLVDQYGLKDAVKDLSGDFGVEVSPGTFLPSGAVLIGTSDEAATKAFLDRLATLVAGEMSPFGGGGGSFQHLTYEGVDITYLPLEDMPGFEIAYTVHDGMAVVATSTDEVKSVLHARSSGDDITQAANFEEAVGDRVVNDGMLYLDVEAIVRAVRDVLPPDARAEFDSDIQPNLEPIRALAVTGSGGSSVTRVFLLIR
jgi:hypothetical protein